MKAILTKFFTFVIVFGVATSYATTHNVTVTDGGFVPSSFTALVGDTVLWATSASNQFQNNTFSTSVPTGAATWNSGVMGPGPVVSFMYVITVAGSYSYEMNDWDTHTGSFTATVSGPPPSNTFHIITITDNGFSPDTLTANAGDTILWTASLANTHTNNTVSAVIPTNALPWNSGGLTAGQTFMYVITTPGVYNYQSNSANNFTANFTIRGTVSNTHLVVITDNGFLPDSFSINVGDTITWLAAAGNQWLVNSFSVSIPTDAAGWTSGGLNPGQTFSYVVTTPGHYSVESDSFYVLSAVFTVPGTISNTHLIIATDNGFLPDSFSANVGDTITWLAAAGNLWKVNSFSLTIPTGAATWTSGGLEPGQTFSYVITEPGTYNYESDSFYTLYAKFIVAAATSVAEVQQPVPGLIFQNPISSQLTVMSGQPGLVTIYDILGNKVAGAPLEFSNSSVQINMEGLYSGVYLIAFTSNGKLVQTYKVVKVN